MLRQRRRPGLGGGTHRGVRRDPGADRPDLGLLPLSEQREGRGAARRRARRRCPGLPGRTGEEDPRRRRGGIRQPPGDARGDPAEPGARGTGAGPDRRDGGEGRGRGVEQHQPAAASVQGPRPGVAGARRGGPGGAAAVLRDCPALSYDLAARRLPAAATDP